MEYYNEFGHGNWRVPEHRPGASDLGLFGLDPTDHAARHGTFFIVAVEPSDLNSNVGYSPEADNLYSSHAFYAPFERVQTRFFNRIEKIHLKWGAFPHL